MSNTIYNKVTINGTTYMDLSQDTVADASHIRQGYVGHLNDGTQVTGTYGGGSNSIVISDTLDSAGGTIRTITTSDDPIMHQQKTNITPGASSITIVPDTGYDAMTSVQINGDANLIAANIKSGVSIFGVTGTHEGSSGSGSGSGSGITQDQDGYIILPSTGSGSGSGSSSSATQHIVHFEFTDSTTTDLNVYYDDPLFSTMITSYIPETYNSKTVNTVALDNTIWYTKPTEVWEVIYNDSAAQANGEEIGSYFWLSSLSDIYPTEGSVWRITLNNIEYRCTAVYTLVNPDGGYSVCVGNPDPPNEWGGDDESGVPVGFYNAGWGAWLGPCSLPGGSYPLKIERLVSSS